MSGKASLRAMGLILCSRKYLQMLRCMAQKYNLEFLNNLEYEVDYRDVRYPRIELKTGNLLIVLPKENKDPAYIIRKHKEWIRRKVSIIEESLKEAQDKDFIHIYFPTDVKRLATELVAEFSTKDDLNVKDIHIRPMNSKWGSYSRKGTLTLNTRLDFLPMHLIRYVVFHELMHSVERGHNATCWGLISKEFPNYGQSEKELLMYWFLMKQRKSIE